MSSLFQRIAVAIFGAFAAFAIMASSTAQAQVMKVPVTLTAKDGSLSVSGNLQAV